MEKAFRESAQMSFSSNPQVRILAMAAQRNRGAHLHRRGAVPSDIYLRPDKDRATENKRSSLGRQVQAKMLRTPFHHVSAGDPGTFPVDLPEIK